MTLVERSPPCAVVPREYASAESMSWGRRVSGESSGRFLPTEMLWKILSWSPVCADSSGEERSSPKAIRRMELYCHLKSGHLSVSPIKTGDRVTYKNCSTL